MLESRYMRIFHSLILIVCTFFAQSQDTFSIIAADASTGEVGAAGASCVDGIAQWGGIQVLNKIIPGKGGVNAQAWICLNPHSNLVSSIEKLNDGFSPQEVIDWIVENDQCAAQNYNPDYRQYGVVDIDNNNMVRVAAHTGNQANDYKGHILGENYAIQGNILLGPEVLEGMEQGFLSTEGSLAEKLMGAIQGANIPGADQRCLARGTSSTSAFLRVVKPEDDPESPYLDLGILEMPFGEEPIDSLQTLFNEWSTSNNYNISSNSLINIFPNPAKEFISISASENVFFDKIIIYDAQGQKVIEESMPTSLGFKQIELTKMEPGIILIGVYNNEELISLEKLFSF